MRSVPGLLTVFFSAEPVSDFAGASACDAAAYGRFCRAMLDRGVYPPPSQFEAWFPSLAHDERAEVTRTLEAAKEAFRAAFAEGWRSGASRRSKSLISGPEWPRPIHSARSRRCSATART